MQSLIKILRQHLVLCKQLDSLLERLRTNLKAKIGSDVSLSTQTIEPIMLELSKSEKAINELLTAKHAESLKSLVDSHNESVEREVANKLLTQIAEVQDKVRHQIVNSATLLVNSKSFIEYNMNVMSQATASTTYGAAGKQSTGQRRRSVFEANI